MMKQGKDKMKKINLVGLEHNKVYLITCRADHIDEKGIRHLKKELINQGIKAIICRVLQHNDIKIQEHTSYPKKPKVHILREIKDWPRMEYLEKGASTLLKRRTLVKMFRKLFKKEK